MTCANILVGLGKDREGMETGDAGWEGGDAAICVAPRRERRQITRAEVVTIVFQSTLPRRERHPADIDKDGKDEFQSTLPRRERRRLCRSAAWFELNFNPRSREGSDVRNTKINLGKTKISIHAPAKGAIAQIQYADLGDNFNPCSREGSDCRPENRRSALSHFNPRSREGSDPVVHGRWIRPH